MVLGVLACSSSQGKTSDAGHGESGGSGEAGPGCGMCVHGVFKCQSPAASEMADLRVTSERECSVVLNEDHYQVDCQKMLFCMGTYCVPFAQEPGKLTLFMTDSVFATCLQ